MMTRKLNWNAPYGGQTSINIQLKLVITRHPPVASPSPTPRRLLFNFLDQPIIIKAAKVGVY